MKTLYFDCFAGASGNMILGALIALGVNENRLIEQIKLLDITDFDIKIKKVEKSGISAIHAAVIVSNEHAHRHLHTIQKIIIDSRLSDNVKARAVEIFTKLAAAEAKIHGIEIEKVHFHEVGAMDAIIDVVGACVGFEILEIENFVCSKIHVGSGFATMEHGTFPVPPPAVVELLKGTPIYSSEIEGELMTPTGAAIIATVCKEFGNIPEMIIEKTAYGAGTREYKNFPNVLRLMLGEVQSPSSREQSQLTTDNLLLLETNIDDLSPQTLGFVMERAFELGALDCWFTPIQMKKNRPAIMVSILCSKDKKEILSKLLYTETTTLGIRVKEVERDCLERESQKIKTEFGEVNVKIAVYKGQIVNVKPEYEQLRQISLNSGMSLQEVEKKVLSESEKFIERK